MNGHRNLGVWNLAGDLVREVYAVVRSLPRDEQIAVGTQLKRAAWSVQNNIAEGVARRGRAEFRRFVEISLSSLAEIDSMIGTLDTVCALDPDRVTRVETLRRQITAGELSLCLRRPYRRAPRPTPPKPNRDTPPPTPPTPSQEIVP